MRYMINTPSPWSKGNMYDKLANYQVYGDNINTH